MKFAMLSTPDDVEKLRYEKHSLRNFLIGEGTSTQNKVSIEYKLLANRT